MHMTTGEYMEAIPILGGLKDSQFDKLLEICEKKDFPKGADIYSEGDRSLDMYILTDGILKVSLWGKEVSRIFPIRPVGEMGLFTGDPRSATITAMSNATLLHITKDRLFDLFEEDKDLHIRFQLGMILDLSEKMRLTNEVIVKMRSKVENKR